MTYATQQDLIERFGETELIQLTDRAEPPSGAIDAAVIARALADADDQINAYLAARYTVPMSPAPKLLTRLAADLARYALYEDRVTEIVRQRFDAAIAQLKDIAAGKASLGVDAAGDEPASSGGPEAEANDRVFTRGRPSTGAAGTLDDYLG